VPPRTQLRLVTIRDSIDIIDRQHRCSRPRREDGHTAVEVNVRIRDPAEQGFDEIIDALPGLLR
jgi:hypothetical protein